MDNISVNKKTEIKKKVNKISSDVRNLSSGAARSNPVIDSLITEGGEDFYSFLKYLKLNCEKDIMVLSPKHHYYFEYRDLIDVKILINIVKLNQIKNLGSFLSTLFRVLPPRSKFIGCFSDSKSTNGSRFPFFPPAKMFNKMINFLDSKTERDMGRKDAIKYLEAHGFSVEEMEEINDLIYFLSTSSKVK